MALRYRKHFLPLESNPEVFTELIHHLGVSDEIFFEDVFVLDEPELPRPTLALVLLLPTTPTYEQKKTTVESSRSEHSGSGAGEPVVWFKQTINNACGLYAILHALSNGEARRYVATGSLLDQLLEACIPETPDERARLLEDSAGLEQAYAVVATKGDSAVPHSAEDEVDYHYICFVRSEVDGCLYELDGDSKGPVALGKIALRGEGDILGPETIDLIKRYLDQEQDSIGFSLMALVRRGR
ncbi:hypothetical protein VTI74DRAFT_6892 [Chaetomium olivicolor]